VGSVVTESVIEERCMYEVDRYDVWYIMMCYRTIFKETLKGEDGGRAAHFLHRIGPTPLLYALATQPQLTHRYLGGLSHKKPKLSTLAATFIKLQLVD